MSTLIKRSTAIPCSKTREYTTVEDFQTQIDVCVYEGERPHVSGNNKLGEFSVEGLYRGKAGEAKVDVTFALDANGILSVSANDKASGAKQQITITSEKGRLSEDEIKRMVAEAEEFAEEDAKLRSAVEARNGFESYAYQLKASSGALDLPDEAKERLDAALGAALAWLDDHATADEDATNEERKKLEDVANPILASAYAAKDESANAGVPSEGATVEDDDDDLDIPDME